MSVSVTASVTAIVLAVGAGLYSYASDLQAVGAAASAEVGHYTFSVSKDFNELRNEFAAAAREVGEDARRGAHEVSIALVQLAGLVPPTSGPWLRFLPASAALEGCVLLFSGLTLFLCRSQRPKK